MASRGSRNIMRSARCVLVKTQFGKVGDSVEFTMPEPGLLTPENFTRKTIVTAGSFCTKFDDGDDYTMVKEIWPLNQHRHPGKFSTFSLEENSQYYCVIPLNGLELITSTQQLNSGTVVELAVGTINFVYGQNYQINSIDYSGTDLFAIEKNPATLTVTDTVTLVQCQSRSS